MRYTTVVMLVLVLCECGCGSPQLARKTTCFYFPRVLYSIFSSFLRSSRSSSLRSGFRQRQRRIRRFDRRRNDFRFFAGNGVSGREPFAGSIGRSQRRNRFAFFRYFPFTFFKIRYRILGVSLCLSDRLFVRYTSSIKTRVTYRFARINLSRLSTR